MGFSSDQWKDIQPSEQGASSGMRFGFGNFSKDEIWYGKSIFYLKNEGCSDSVSPRENKKNHRKWREKPLL